MLDWLRKLFGVASTTVASAPLMGIPGAVQAGAEAVRAVTQGMTEANRAATLRAIALELAENSRRIDKAIEEAQKRKTAHITIPPAVVLLALLALWSLGCASAPPRTNGTATGNVGRLLGHPEFPAAAVAAPSFTKDAMNTVNGLESDLQVEKARANQVR